LLANALGHFAARQIPGAKRAAPSPPAFLFLFGSETPWDSSYDGSTISAEALLLPEGHVDFRVATPEVSDWDQLTTECDRLQNIYYDGARALDHVFSFVWDPDLPAVDAQHFDQCADPHAE
jgi:hypothetical protein